MLIKSSFFVYDVYISMDLGGAVHVRIRRVYIHNIHVDTRYMHGTGTKYTVRARRASACVRIT